MKLTEGTSTVPNRGSDEAVQLGCKCARMDNAYGKGYLCQPGIFVYTEGCSVHWLNTAGRAALEQEGR